MFGVGISVVGAALGSLNFIGSAARQRGDLGSALVFLALVGSARLFSVILSVGKPAQKGFLGGPWVEDEQSSFLSLSSLSLISKILDSKSVFVDLNAFFD